MHTSLFKYHHPNPSLVKPITKATLLTLLLLTSATAGFLTSSLLTPEPSTPEPPPYTSPLTNIHYCPNCGSPTQVTEDHTALTTTLTCPDCPFTITLPITYP